MKRKIKKRIKNWRRREIWFLDKRTVLAAILVGVFILVNQLAKASNAQVADDFKTPQSNLELLKSKLKGDAGWKPVGWGTGEYLADIPTIKAGAVLDYDSGNVIWSMNLKQKTATASLSKLATVTTALDIAEADHMISVSDDAASQVPTILGLKAGERLTLDEAAAAAIMTSANDATEAIADSLGREYGFGLSGFTELANYKMVKLGALDSHLVTATGLDDNSHYSTVFDLAILAHWAKINYPLVASDASNIYRRLDANQNHKMYDLPNWNALLGTYPGVSGLKIGYTEAAGYSTIVTAERDGKKIMAIVIGADSLENREKAAAVLLNYGFSKNGIDPFPVSDLNLTKRYEDWKAELTPANP